jgi:hypothetical protein
MSKSKGMCLISGCFAMIMTVLAVMDLRDGDYWLALWSGLLAAINVYACIQELDLSK